MTKEQILGKFIIELNMIYAENENKALAHLKAGDLSSKYMSLLKIMVKGGSMTKDEYDWITTQMIKRQINEVIVASL